MFRDGLSQCRFKIQLDAINYLSIVTPQEYTSNRNSGPASAKRGTVYHGEVPIDQNVQFYFINISHAHLPFPLKHKDIQRLELAFQTFLQREKA